MQWRDFENAITRAMQPLKNRVALMIGRALLTAVKDDGTFQLMQMSGLMNQPMDNVPRYGQFGFASNPPPGSELIVVAMQGNRENLIVISAEHASRLKNLASGESALYNLDGAKWHLKNGKVLEGLVSTFSITNDEHEFVQVLVDLVSAIIAARTETAIGPMPLLSVDDPFPDIKTRLETFKT